MLITYVINVFGASGVQMHDVRLSSRRSAMYEHFQPSAPVDSKIDWEQRFCPTDWCTLDTLYVRRYDHVHEVWHVTDDRDHSGWLVAATAPVCPHCGGNLLTGANLLEGVDGVEKYAAR
jgi:hypothetical protein